MAGKSEVVFELLIRGIVCIDKKKLSNSFISRDAWVRTKTCGYMKENVVVYLCEFFLMKFDRYRPDQQLLCLNFSYNVEWFYFRSKRKRSSDI